MKTQKITTWLLLSSLVAPYVSAADITQKSTGDCSPNIVAKGNAVVNCGLFKEEVEKIVAVYNGTHHLSDEQVAALTIAVVALGKGIGTLGSETEINAAITALRQGNTEKAKALFLKEAQRGEISAKQTAEAYRNLGALLDLDNNQEALKAYRRATELDPDNVEGWNKLGYLLKSQIKLDDSMAAYQKALELQINIKNQQGIADAYFKLGELYQIQFYKLVDEPLTANLINDRPGELFDRIYESVHKSLKLNSSQLTQLDNAITMHQKALEFEIRENNSIKIEKNYLELYSLYKMQNEEDKADEIFKKLYDYRAKEERVHKKLELLNYLKEYEKAMQEKNYEKIKSLSHDAEEKGIISKIDMPDSEKFKGKGFFEIVKESFKELKFKK